MIGRMAASLAEIMQSLIAVIVLQVKTRYHD